MAAAFAVCFAGAAHAATLVTPMVDAASDEKYDCNVVNAGSGAVSVKISLVAVTGDVLAGPFDLTIGPGEANRVSYVEDEYTTGAFCRFVVEGPKKDLRASIAVFDGTHNTVQADAR